MRRLISFGLLCAALVIPQLAFAQAAEVPTCQGRDILADLKTRDPDGYAKIRAVADATPNAQALLWRIEREGRPPSYLFGTIHSTDPRVTSLSPAVTTAFESADTVALEIVYTSPDTIAVMTKQITERGLYRDRQRPHRRPVSGRNGDSSNGARIKWHAGRGCAHAAAVVRRPDPRVSTVRETPHRRGPRRS
jgi:hypothetical protein